jgi:hypothetical protein
MKVSILILWISSIVSAGSCQSKAQVIYPRIPENSYLPRLEDINLPFPDLTANDTRNQKAADNGLYSYGVALQTALRALRGHYVEKPKKSVFLHRESVFDDMKALMDTDSKRREFMTSKINTTMIGEEGSLLISLTHLR